MSITHPDVAKPTLGRLERLSAFMCWVVAAGGAFAGLALIWIWLSPTIIETVVVPRLGLAGVPVTLDAATRAVCFAVTSVSAAVLGWLLYQAYALFDAYRRGHVFTDDAPARLRRIGVSMLVLAALRPVTVALLGVILTWPNPPGQRILTLGVGLDDIMLATFGGLILAIGHVMAEAKRLSDDNRAIV
jgi:hypothetical protein